MERTRLNLLVLLAVTAVVMPCARAEENGVSRDIPLLRETEKDGKVARAASLSASLRGQLGSLWDEQLLAALPRPPEGWTGSAPFYEREDGAWLQIHVDPDPNPWDKPGDGNLVWIRWVRRGMLEGGAGKETRLAGHQAYYTEGGAQEGLVLGLVLAHGATFGVKASPGITLEVFREAFGDAIDLAGIERHLWPLGEGELSMPETVGSLAALYRAGRLRAAQEMARRLEDRHTFATASRMAPLLPEVPEGWSAGDVLTTDTGGGARRRYQLAEGRWVDVWFGWVAAPTWNGLLRAFREPARRWGKQRVVSTGDVQLLVDGAYAYGFFADGNFQFHIHSRGLTVEQWLEPLFKTVDPTEVEEALQKVW